MMQREFVFTLRDHPAGRPIWSLTQDRVSRASPCALHVSDSGWVAVQAHNHVEDEVVIISPRGERTLVLDPVAALAADPSAAGKILESSVGKIWDTQSHASFHHLAGREHFCLRAWWGSRILLDLERSQRVDPAEHEATLLAEEQAWSSQVLAARSATWSEDPFRDPEGLDETLTAITVAGQCQNRAAEPALRIFEASEVLWTKERYLFRPSATLALRRIGARPRRHASYLFPGLDLPECVIDLDRRLKDLAPGQTREDVLRVLGAPDFMPNHSSWVWDAAENDRSFVAKFGQSLQLIWEVRPPRWRTDEREYSHVLGIPPR